MANIDSKLNAIKGAIYGADVRTSIADGIEAINIEVESTTSKQVALENTFEDLVINAGNSNAEIVVARSGEVDLATKIGKIDSSLSDNVTLINDVKIKRGKYVIFGDSTSAGTPALGRDMATWLSFKLGQTVINKGVWGDSFLSLKTRIQADVIDLKPKYCIILCGTNDIFNNRGIDVIKADIDDISNTLMDNNIKPVWLTICPRTDYPALTPTIIKHNYWLQNYCRVNGFLFVDVYSGLLNDERATLSVKSEVLLPDLLHLEAEGHRLNVNAIYNVLQTNKSDILPSICGGDLSVIIPNQRFSTYSNYPTTKIADGWTMVYGSEPTTIFDFEEMAYDKDTSRRFQTITMPTQTTTKVAGIKTEIGAQLIPLKTYNISFDIDFSATEMCLLNVYIQPNTNSPKVAIGAPTKCLLGAEILNINERISFNYTPPSLSVLHDLIITANGKAYVMKLSNFNCHMI